MAFEDVATPDPATTASAQGHLRVTVKDPDQKKVGKPFTTAVVESALGSYPGMFPTAPPGEGTPFGVYWPTLVARGDVTTSVTVDGVQQKWTDPWVDTDRSASGEGRPRQEIRPMDAPVSDPAAWSPEPGTRLGAIVGARSGDKGGNANIGLWIPAPGEGVSAALDEAAVDARAAWLRSYVTEQRVRELLPEAAGLAVDVHPLPNLRAVNVVIHGLLGRGVADSTSLDPQAKGLGEHVRARIVI